MVSAASGIGEISVADEEAENQQDELPSSPDQTLAPPTASAAGINNANSVPAMDVGAADQPPDASDAAAEPPGVPSKGKPIELA